MMLWCVATSVSTVYGYLFYKPYQPQILGLFRQFE